MPVISEIQKEILKIFPSVPDADQFYLTGGSALAEFYLKHRKSNDLDFFTSVEAALKPVAEKLQEVLISHGFIVERKRTLISFVEFLVCRGAEKTIIQLARDTPFRFEPTREFLGYPGLKVDALVDIASNKLGALFGRAMLRDFLDVYCLIKKASFQKGDLVAKAQQKDPGFDMYWLGVAFERIKTFDASSPEMALLMEPIAFEDVRMFFDFWRKEIATDL